MDWAAVSAGRPPGTRIGDRDAHRGAIAASPRRYTVIELLLIGGVIFILGTLVGGRLQQMNMAARERQLAAERHALAEERRESALT